jgi:hypothetical protein
VGRAADGRGTSDWLARVRFIVPSWGLEVIREGAAGAPGTLQRPQADPPVAARRAVGGFWGWGWTVASPSSRAGWSTAAGCTRTAAGTSRAPGPAFAGCTTVSSPSTTWPVLRRGDGSGQPVCVGQRLPAGQRGSGRNREGHRGGACTCIRAGGFEAWCRRSLASDGAPVRGSIALARVSAAGDEAAAKGKRGESRGGTPRARRPGHHDAGRWQRLVAVGGADPPAGRRSSGPRRPGCSRGMGRPGLEGVDATTGICYEGAG